VKVHQRLLKSLRVRPASHSQPLALSLQAAVCVSSSCSPLPCLLLWVGALQREGGRDGPAATNERERERRPCALQTRETALRATNERERNEMIYKRLQKAKMTYETKLIQTGESDTMSTKNSTENVNREINPAIL